MSEHNYIFVDRLDDRVAERVGGLADLWMGG